MCAAALARLLAKILDACRQQEPTSFFEPMPQVSNENPQQDRLSMANQLTSLKLELEQLENKLCDVSVSQVSACAATLNAVMKLLLQQSKKSNSELHHLVTEIHELDQIIALH